MQTNTVEQEYDGVASEFGRRIANRWLFATMQKAGKRDGFTIEDFYACYGNEEELPEHEWMQRDDRYTLDVVRWHAFYEQGNPWVVGREKMAKELAALGNINPDNLIYLAWLVSRPPSEAAAEFKRLQASADENEQNWFAWLRALDNAAITDIWILVFRRWPSPYYGEAIDAALEPYRPQGGSVFSVFSGEPVANEQAMASTFASTLSSTVVDYSKIDYGPFALWRDGRTVSDRAAEEVLKRKGERTQAKIDRKTNKGAV